MLTLDQTEVQLQATALSGLPVVFFSSDTTVACVEGNTLKIKSAGSVIITATDKGNTEYAAAPDVQQNLQIVARTGIETQNKNLIKVSFHNKNLLSIEGLYEKTQIVLISEKGQIILSNYTNDSVCNFKIDRIPAGTYILSLSGATIKMNQKIIL